MDGDLPPRRDLARRPTRRTSLLGGLGAGSADGKTKNLGSARREIVGGLIVGGGFVLAFLGWGLIAQLDAAVYAPGAVTVFGSRQSVQHRDGGIVSELDVREGDRVQSGQVLLRLSGSDDAMDVPTLRVCTASRLVLNMPGLDFGKASDDTLAELLRRQTG